MSRRKQYHPNVPCHIYSRAFNSFCIFYSLEDFLVFTSVYHFYARQYGIKTIILCIMINHYHCLVLAPDRTSFIRFVQTVESVFAKQYNEAHKRSGAVFRRRFGWALKTIGKKVKTNISYIANNPVAGKLTLTAESYRWNFLAYFNNPHPFSKAIDRSKCSRKLKRAMDLLRIYTDDGSMFIGYVRLRQLFSGLAQEEVQQFTDLIVSMYNPVDYKEIIKYFGSFEKALLVFESNTGEEHDLKEDWDDYSKYREMLKVARKYGYEGMINFEAIDDIEEISHLQFRLAAETGANNKQIRKFLHISDEEK